MSQRVLPAAAFPPLTGLVAALLSCVLAALPGRVNAKNAGAPAGVVSISAQALTAPGRSSFDGVVEAVRQTTLAAQVPGAVIELPVWCMHCNLLLPAGGKPAMSATPLNLRHSVRLALRALACNAPIA